MVPKLRKSRVRSRAPGRTGLGPVALRGGAEDTLQSVLVEPVSYEQTNFVLRIAIHCFDGLRADTDLQTERLEGCGMSH
jgi:hypothetical protein